MSLSLSLCVPRCWVRRRLLLQIYNIPMGIFFHLVRSGDYRVVRSHSRRVPGDSVLFTAVAFLPLQSSALTEDRRVSHLLSDRGRDWWDSNRWRVHRWIEPWISLSDLDRADNELCASVYRTEREREHNYLSIQFSHTKRKKKSVPGFDQHSRTRTQRMNKRQEVMRTTFNTYGHNSNRHFDGRKSLAPARQREKKRDDDDDDNENERHIEREKDRRNSCVTCSIRLSWVVLFSHFVSLVCQKNLQAGGTAADGDKLMTGEILFAYTHETCHQRIRLHSSPRVDVLVEVYALGWVEISSDRHVAPHTQRETARSTNDLVLKEISRLSTRICISIYLFIYLSMSMMKGQKHCASSYIDSEGSWYHRHPLRCFASFSVSSPMTADQPLIRFFSLSPSVIVIKHYCWQLYRRIYAFIYDRRAERERPSTSIAIADLDDASSSISLVMINVLLYTHTHTQIKALSLTLSLSLSFIDRFRRRLGERGLWSGRAATRVKRAEWEWWSSLTY